MSAEKINGKAIRVFSSVKLKQPWETRSSWGSKPIKIDAGVKGTVRGVLFVSNPDVPHDKDQITVEFAGFPGRFTIFREMLQIA